MYNENVVVGKNTDRCLFNDDFTVFPNERIGRYMAFLKYKIYYGDDDDTVLNKLKFWGYSEEEFKPLFENGKEFLHEYLYEELVGTEYQTWAKYNNEISELVREKRKHWQM